MLCRYSGCWEINAVKGNKKKKLQILYLEISCVAITGYYTVRLARVQAVYQWLYTEGALPIPAQLSGDMWHLAGIAANCC